MDCTHAIPVRYCAWNCHLTGALVEHHERLLSISTMMATAAASNTAATVRRTGNRPRAPQLGQFTEPEGILLEHSLQLKVTKAASG